MSPFLILASIGVLFGLYYFIGSKLSADDMPYLLCCLGSVIVLTLITLFIVKHVCATIHPTERFDNAPILLSTFIQQVVATEQEVCTLITQTDKFIKGDQGSAGHKDPTLVTAAQQKARAAVVDPATKQVVPLTDCGTPWDASEVANRISRLELTLKMFTGPEIQKTYNSTVPCEPFDSGPANPNTNPEPTADPALVQRLAAINAEITSQRTVWLTPIQTKMAALKKGQPSDCDKKKGGTTGQAAVAAKTSPPNSGTTPTPPPPPT